ncbi:glycosyltransferase family 4 protein [Methylolobus aquaticus]
MTTAKRLLSVNSYYYRRDGSEVVYFDHNACFEAQGWTVVPFAMQHPNNRTSDWSRFFVDEIEFGHEYGLVEKIRRVPKVIYSREAQRKLRLLLDNVSVDIAHCHSIYHHLSPSILPVLAERQIPVVMTLHDLKIACPAYHMHRAGFGVCEACRDGGVTQVFRNRCVKSSAALSFVIFLEAAVNGWLGSYQRYVQRFVCPCQFYADKLAEWGWDPQRFTVIPNAIDLTGWEPSYGAGGHFLYFGRLSAEKGLLTLVRAAAAAGVEVRLAGDGPQRAELEAESLRLGARVKFLGHLQETELRAAIAACRATVLPAEWYENAPMSVLESYAMGKPVLGADIGGLPELIELGRTGWLHSSGSAEALASCLREIRDMKDAEVEELGRASRAHVEHQHSLTQYTRRMLDLYDTLDGRQH